MTSQEKLGILYVLKQEIERLRAELEEMQSMDVICQNKDCQHPFCPEHSLESN